MSAEAGTVSRLWSDFAVKRAKHGRDAWMFALDHPRIRQHVYNRYLEGLDPFSFARRKLGLAGGGHALEIGCGGGDLALSVLRTQVAARVDAFDVATGAIDVARAKAEAAGVSGAHFFVADGGNLALEAGKYDFAYASHALHHVEGLEHLFESVARALKPGGAFFADDFIGPSRMQYTDTHLALINTVFARLPEDKRLDSTASFRVKPSIQRVPIETYLRVDPSEGVRAAEIVDVMSQFFHVEVYPTGMSIMYETMLGIVGNFDPDDAADNALVDMMLAADDICSEFKLVPPVFACLLARPK